MIRYKPLPTAADLPETDHQPLDSELQYLIPVLLRSTLALAWGDRMDWFFGVNLGIYYDPEKPAICPDAFLSLNVTRCKPSGPRLSYVLWEEQNILPIWVLEIVSKTPGNEYTEKMQKYARMGVQYYTIFNAKHSQRDGHDVFEAYCLTDGVYVRQPSSPVWMPEVGIGIGVDYRELEGYRQGWLSWYDQQGCIYPIPEDVIAQAKRQTKQAEQRAEQAEQKAEQAEQRAEQAEQRRAELLRKLKLHNIDPDSLEA